MYKPGSGLNDEDEIVLKVVNEVSESMPSLRPSIALAERIRMHCAKPIDPNIQQDLARLVNLLPLLEKVDDPVLYAQAQLIADCLLTDDPKVRLAQPTLKRLSERLRARTSPIPLAIRNGSPAIRVVLGLAVLLYFVLPLSMVVLPFLSRYDTLFGVKIETLGLVSFFGALGSIVSIMVRLHDLAKVKTPDSSILFFTGLFKPIVGTAFALFLFSVISSGLLPVVIQSDKAQFFFAAISFLAGFSERLVHDVVAKTESSIVASRKQDA